MLSSVKLPAGFFNPKGVNLVLLRVKIFYYKNPVYLNFFFKLLSFLCRLSSGFLIFLLKIL